MGELSIKIYIHNKKEVIEITPFDGSGQTERHIFDLGQTLVDFTLTDFSEIKEILGNAQEQIDKFRRKKCKSIDWGTIIEDLQKAAEVHIYFTVFLKRALEMRGKPIESKDRNYFGDVRGDIDVEVEDVRTIITECLDEHSGPPSAIGQRFGQLQDKRQLKGSMRDWIWYNNSYFVLHKGGLEPATKQDDEAYKFVEVMEPEGLFDILRYFTAYMMCNEVPFKRCKNCGQYFAIPGSSKVEYCGRLIEGSTKTCREAGPLRVYQKRKFDNPVLQAYNRAYKARNARVHKGKMDEGEFADWSQIARDLRDKCLAGEMNLEDFLKWLKL